MIATATMQTEVFGVAQNRIRSVRALEDVREEAAREMAVALDGVSVKKIKSAGVIGAGATFLSRAQNGDSGNPLFRLASLFVLGRALGIPKSRFQRILDWLQSQLDKAYGDAPTPSVKEVLERDAELDPRDDYLRHKASHGCKEARRQLVNEKQEQIAHARTVIFALEAGD